jgi:dihydropteroate synthase
MCAAIVGNNHFTCTVMVMRGAGIMTAAATDFVKAAGNSGNYLIRSAVLAGVTDEGIPKTP